MAGEQISSDAAAGWSRRNVADVAVALIGFGLIVTSIDGLMTFVLHVLSALLPGFAHYFGKPALLRACGIAFVQLFLGLWLNAHHRKISARLFRSESGAPVAEQRAALAFGIKVYAVYLAAFSVVMLSQWTVEMVASGLNYLKWFRLLICLVPLIEIPVCLYFLKRPGWPVSLAYPEAESDEVA